MSKIDDKILRTKYIRALEKFAFKATLLLKYENFDVKIFEKNIKKNKILLDKAKKIALYNSYLNRLEKYVEMVLSSVENMENFKQDVLLKEANLLDKDKNSGKYKKDKHKGYDDGY